MNQVLVHAGLNYLVLEKTADESLYVQEGAERKISIRQNWKDVVEKALGGRKASSCCEEDNSYISRMPQAPEPHVNEEAYFNYLGSLVPSFESVVAADSPHEIVINGEFVEVLRKEHDYTVQSQNAIEGRIEHLCRLARGQRIILGHDLCWTYIVTGKNRTTQGCIAVNIRRGRPITDIGRLRDLLGE